MIDFAKKLKGLRETREWSQDELAKRLGISRSTIGNYEQGIREPDFETLEKIADVFNCPISYLMEDTPEAKSIRDGYKRGFPVNGTEMLIIEHYRIADPDIQKAILKLLDLEYAFGGGYESSLGLSKAANDR